MVENRTDGPCMVSLGKGFQSWYSFNGDGWWRGIDRDGIKRNIDRMAKIPLAGIWISCENS